jgi:hypothetical protein
VIRTVEWFRKEMDLEPAEFVRPRPPVPDRAVAARAKDRARTARNFAPGAGEQPRL